VAKYFASDRHVTEVQIEGARTGSTRTLRPDAKGFYEVGNSADAKALKDSGFVEASLMGIAQGNVGVICAECGFNGFFALCGRCGHDNKAEPNVDA